MKVNQLRAGVVMTYLNIGLGSLIPIFYTPIMLRILGQSEYGLYSLANSVVGYLSLLTFGLGSTIVRYVAKYRAEGDKEGEEKVIGLFILMYSFLAIFVLIGGAIISGNVEAIFHRGLTDSEITKIAILVQIMAFNTAISFPISVFGSIRSRDKTAGILWAATGRQDIRCFPSAPWKRTEWRKSAGFWRGRSRFWPGLPG